MARVISIDDAIRLAYSEGARGNALVTAVAVAMAESNLNAEAHNPDAGTGDNSYGLWQINMLGGMGPERRKRYELDSNEALWDARTNARVAAAMSGGWKNFQPWTTFTKGKYKQYVSQVAARVKALGGDIAAGYTGPTGDMTAVAGAKRAGRAVKPGTLTVEDAGPEGFTADEVRELYRVFAGRDPDTSVLAKLQATAADATQLASEIQKRPESEAYRAAQFGLALQEDET